MRCLPRFSRIIKQWLLLLIFCYHLVLKDIHKIFTTQVSLLKIPSWELARGSLSRTWVDFKCLTILLQSQSSRRGSDKEYPWPWALRQAAIYHSLDLENGRATWVTVKANDILARRIAESNEIMHEAPSTIDNTTPFDVSLYASLASHLIICDWAAESWRWYINFLENRLQENSRASLSVMADGDPKALDEWAKAPGTRYKYSERRGGIEDRDNHQTIYSHPFVQDFTRSHTKQACYRSAQLLTT
ncbi:hypothetical protein BDV97DRAFT_88807 [Delphinella strobiligena]|nr:hypothetical protein BDV97DRAFT_88807 [Delphinella strobiligena]